MAKSSLRNNTVEALRRQGLGARHASHIAHIKMEMRIKRRNDIIKNTIGALVLASLMVFGVHFSINQPNLAERADPDRFSTVFLLKGGLDK